MDVTQRGQLSPEDEERIMAAWMESRRSTVAYKRLIAEMVDKSSYREVSRVTGVSTATLQKWKREAGA